MVAVIVYVPLIISESAGESNDTAVRSASATPTNIADAMLNMTKNKKRFPLLKIELIVLEFNLTPPKP